MHTAQAAAKKYNLPRGTIYTIILLALAILQSRWCAEMTEIYSKATSILPEKKFMSYSVAVFGRCI